MNTRELEQLKKKSIHYVELSSDYKDQVIQSHLNELSKVVKKEVKRKNLVVLVVEEK
jgi:ABC-type hemin transport system substrate-binding protein